MYDDVIFADRFRNPLTIFGDRVLIWLSRLLHALIAYEIDTVTIVPAFCRISNYLYDYIWLNSIACVSKRQDVRWCSLHWSIPLSINYIWKSSTDRVIANPSCSYCIRNRYCHNHSSVLMTFPLFASFDTVEFNRLPCSNNEMYDNIVFAFPFRYQLTMFEVCVLIWLSPLLYTHIAYEIVM